MVHLWQLRIQGPRPETLRIRGLAIVALAIGLGGCAALPVSGPTGSQVIKASTSSKEALKFDLVELSDTASLPATPEKPAIVVPRLPPPPTDMIGPGDVLDVSVYEAGITLFAGSRGPAATASSADVSGGVQTERLPPQRVDDDGFIRVPYAGRLRAAGHTPEELASMIRRSLRGMSQNPQVAVTISTIVANSVILGGEVGHPGRLVLTTNRESLADTIALGGGYRGEANDLVVRLERGDRDYEYRLSDVLSASDRDMRVVPGDRIEILRRPMTFSVMGAPSKVEQLAFPSASPSLAEAVALAGGANPYLGDAKAIFVFRFVTDAAGKEEPVVYHLNMMHAGAYFLAQRFTLRDKDLLYVGNAAANQPSKLIQLISQLFTPFATVGAVVSNAHL
jgi:polysaccharide export outer membrane protein